MLMQGAAAAQSPASQHPTPSQAEQQTPSGGTPNFYHLQQQLQQ